jgi:hypothetical protein
VVSYDATVEIINILDDLPYPGASMVRDTIRMMYRREDASYYDRSRWWDSTSDEEEEEEEHGERVHVNAAWVPYMTIGSSPALNLEAGQ